MKNFVRLLFFSGFMAFLLLWNSPGAEAQRFSGGLLLGFNGSQVDGDTYAGYNKFGFMGGAWVSTPLSRILDVQFEIKYMGKGANKKVTDASPGKYTSVLNYIELPVIFRWAVNQKIGLEAGLGFGYLFSYYEKNDYGRLSDGESVHFRPFELSSVFGVKYGFNSRISGDLRFSYSVLPILRNPSDQVNYLNKGLYNNVISMGIFYRIGM